MAKQIPLTNGGFTTVDDADYPVLSKYKWRRNARGYVIRGAGKERRMHRVILSAPPGKDVDHKDLDSLNNTRSNLRLCNESQNGANQAVRERSRTGFKGVQFRADRPSPFRARIKINYADHNLGHYSTAEEAARAYDRAAIAAFGEFARLNFPAQAAA